MPEEPVPSTEVLLDALCRRQRLDLLGEITGGLAHALGSPLSVVTGQAELLLARELPPAVREDLEALLAGAQQANRASAQLLALARRLRAARQELDLNLLVEETLELWRRLVVGAQPLLLRELDPRLPWVRGCPGQLQLLLCELLQHCRSATQRLPGLGVVQVRTFARDGRAAVEVEHDGPLVPPEEEARLFDPFADLDAGLGLAWRLARQHGGELRLSRSPEAVFLVLDLPGARP